MILGCTHYPLLKNTIAKQLNRSVVLIDSANAVARTVQKQLTDYNILNNKNDNGSLICFVTDIPMRFKALGKRFLGSYIDSVQIVNDL